MYLNISILHNFIKLKKIFFLFTYNWLLDFIEHIKFKFIFLTYRVVKEEIVDETAHLPCFNGRVVSWVSYFYIELYIALKLVSTYIFHNFVAVFQLVSAEGSNISDGGTSQCTDTADLNKQASRDNGLITETESVVSSRHEIAQHKHSDKYNKYNCE